MPALQSAKDSDDTSQKAEKPMATASYNPLIL